MKKPFISRVEQSYLRQSGIQHSPTIIPYLTVSDFPQLGFLTSLRFLEWVSENPEGVISLPTGKTPEYFIKHTQSLLSGWSEKRTREILDRHGLGDVKRPDLRGLQFVQIDEFYPIDPSQHNSFYNYVLNFYIGGFGLDTSKALLINSDKIPLAGNRHYKEVFPDSRIDLSLRFRDPKSSLEKIQQDSIILIDNWCSEYEYKIREKGGIGFFLGGIGPDGHIAFNTRGSDLYSTTRLTKTNFETQAVAAGDLGGIEVSGNRLSITIGLETITWNRDTVAILFAAGEAKAEIVKNSLESGMTTLYPATVMQRLKNSRFYLTAGAASKLSDNVLRYYKEGAWTMEKTERAVIDLCQKLDKYGHHLTLEELRSDPFCSMIPDLDENSVPSVIKSIKSKMAKGMKRDENEVIYHTGPHHDDIMLGIMPYTNRQVRSATNELHFAIMTSGFTAVTNHFLLNILRKTLELIDTGRVQMLKYPDFFDTGYKFKFDKDVYHYLDNVAKREEEEKIRGLCHRVVRAVTGIYKITNRENLVEQLNTIIEELENSYDGAINPPDIQKLKGMIREFEEELVWAHFGVSVKSVHHLRLGFYKGEIFTENPEKERDILPILEEFRKYKPTIISLALDPEGSGPDTHYKVLQAIAGAVKEWQKEADLSKLRILGYRNVWYKFHPSEVEMIVPVSLNALGILEISFTESYLSQVNASFPSYEYNGKFSELTSKIWVKQLKQIQLLLGKNFFYENDHPMIRATHGLIYIKEMNAEKFIKMARDLEKLTEGVMV